MSVPNGNDFIGTDGGSTNANQGRKKKKILLASLGLLALLSLFVFLDNPGLLIPDQNGGEAEATDNSNDNGNDQADNSNSTPDIRVVETPVIANDTNSADNGGDVQQTSSGNHGGSSGFTIITTPGSGGSTVTTSRGGGSGGGSGGSSGANHTPVASDGQITTDELTLANFVMIATDSDGDVLTFTIVSGPTHGTISGFNNANGQGYYTPTLNYHGPDSITFKARDNHGRESNVATIQITVRQVNLAPLAANVSGITTEEDTPVVVNLTSSVMDPDGDDIAISISTQPANGTAIVNENGTITYSPKSNYNGVDSFAYRASDGALFSNNATVSVTVNPVNDVPLALNFTLSMLEDTPIDITVVNATSDVDGDVNGITIVDPPSHGIVTISDDNITITYTPNQDYNGDDSFTYTLSDGAYDSNIGNVTIDLNPVNDSPIIVPGVFDNIFVLEDSSVTINIIAGVSDPEGDTLTITNVTQPEHGTVDLNEDGTVSYTPDPNYNGEDSFQFTVSDGNGGNTTGTVTIIVTATNDAPDASDDAYSTEEDTALDVMTVNGVLANDTDFDAGDLMSAIMVDSVDNGILTLNNDGGFSYTPNANFYGTDNFTYLAQDQDGAQSEISTVTIAIISANDNPIAHDDHLIVDKVSPNVLPVLNNDFDADGDALTIESVTHPSFGNATINTDDDTITYTAGSGFSDSDSFEYAISDGNGGLATATVIVFDNGVNHAPDANDMNISTDEDTTLITTLVASDIDGETLHFVLTSLAAHGTVTVEDDGTITYAPNPDYFGTDSFTFQANDGMLDSGIATVSITVNAVNDAPVANDDSYSVAEDATLVVTSGQGVLVNENDIEGDTLFAVIVDTTSHGTLIFNSDGSFTYTPNTNYDGQDSFTYVANDGDKDSNIATVTISVSQVNDDPIANNDSAFTTLEAPVLIHVLANDTDFDGNTLRVTTVGLASHGTAIRTSDQLAVIYTPNNGFTGFDHFTYTISDGQGGTATGTVTVYVYPARFGHLQPPVGGGGDHEFEQGNTASVRFKLFDESGAEIRDATVLLRVQQIDEESSPIGAVKNATSAGGANDGPYFRYSSGFYHYDLKTDDMAVGEWALYVYLVDPTYGEILMEDAPIDGISTTIIIK